MPALCFQTAFGVRRIPFIRCRRSEPPATAAWLECLARFQPVLTGSILRAALRSVPASHIMIKTYSPEGVRLRDYSLAAIARLLALRRVVITYSTKGRVLHCTFLPHDGAKTMKRAHRGQKYSVSELLASGRHAWKHSDGILRRGADVICIDSVLRA
jgi:hypothetical protein